jgi:hypothetical protein
MAREPLVEEGVISVHKVEKAAVLANHALEEKLGFLGKRGAKVFIEVRER